MLGKGAGPAASEPRSAVLSESGCAREEAKGGRNLSLPEAHQHSRAFPTAASVGLEHPFLGSKGKPLFLVHPRLGSLPAEQISAYSPMAGMD